jgi:tRNA A22 N-methylase
VWSNLNSSYTNKKYDSIEEIFPYEAVYQFFDVKEEVREICTNSEYLVKSDTICPEHKFYYITLNTYNTSNLFICPYSHGKYNTVKS